jgi:serine/threonine protein kinase
VTEVPGYEISDVLGRGRFGVVHRARQLSVDREVAVRIDTRVPRDQRRFLREVEAAGRLSAHPHVVEIHDAGVLADSRPYLVMELCPGGSLAGRAPMPPREVAEIGQNLADALAAAHDLGVLHGDIKPANILVKHYGTVGLADFGLAALMEAAPEAFPLRPPTPRSDVYALSATLYTLLAGLPAEGEPEIVEDVPGAPPQLMAVLRRGLAIDPAHRYPDAAALRADLSQLTVGDFSGPRQTITTATPTEGDTRSSAASGRPARQDSLPTGAPRRRTTLLVVAALAVVLVLAVVWYLAVA